MIINIDGSFIDPEETPISIDDGGFLFGDTLFETLKIRDGRIFFLEEHLDRIELSARLLGFPFDRNRAVEALRETAARLEAPVGRLRLTATRGVFTSLALPPAAQWRLVVAARPYAEPTAEERAAGAACVFAPNRRVNPLSHLPQMKRGNWADCLYAADHARRHGACEALFVDGEGFVLEGATSNLFILRGDVLVTPPAGELVLAGIMRQQVLRAAERLGLRAGEREVFVEELGEADEVFLTNSLIDLLPVVRVEGRSVRRGPVAERLREEISRATAA